MRGGLDGISDDIFDQGAGFDDAVNAPMLIEPVEAAQILCADLHHRKCATVLVDTCESDARYGFHSVIHGDLPDKPGDEVAEFSFIGTLPVGADIVQAVVLSYEVFRVNVFRDLFQMILPPKKI